MQKYKEKISDLEFVRSRCDELKEDLRVTNETKYMLEEQVSEISTSSDWSARFFPFTEKR